MKLLVTGGAGFIGSNFVIRTLQTRPQVDITVVDALTYAGSRKNLELVYNEIQFERGDIRNTELIDKLVSSVDLVIHFAAETHNDNSLNHPQIFFETNLMGTLNLASACLKYGVRLHHVSTDEVFGDLPIDAKNEFNIDSPYKPSSPYSASKASSDHLIRAWVRSFGLKATISNCSNNYGPRQHWEKLIPATVRSITLGEKPRVYGDGSNIRDWIHVDDHVDGIWAILEHGVIGSTYLLGARNQVSNLKLVQGLLGAANRDPNDFIFVQDRPGHDRKYAINPESSWALGWTPEHMRIENELSELVDYYSNRLREERSS